MIWRCCCSILAGIVKPFRTVHSSSLRNRVVILWAIVLGTFLLKNKIEIEDDNKHVNTLLLFDYMKKTFLLFFAFFLSWLVIRCCSVCWPDAIWPRLPFTSGQLLLLSPPPYSTRFAKEEEEEEAHTSAPFFLLPNKGTAWVSERVSEWVSEWVSLPSAFIHASSSSSKRTTTMSRAFPVQLQNCPFCGDRRGRHSNRYRSPSPRRQEKMEIKLSWFSNVKKWIDIRALSN